MKYRPDFPARIGCIEDARAHCQVFFTWYNTMHRHSGIGYMTPHSVHHGHADASLITRQASLDTAFLPIPTGSRTYLIQRCGYSRNLYALPHGGARSAIVNCMAVQIDDLSAAGIRAIARGWKPSVEVRP